jgi:RNA polymerase sigma-70 factor (ECF subfamily)
VELAFIVAMQCLPPRQTAVLVLHDVLGFSLEEVPGMLDTGPTAVKGLLQRARISLRQHVSPAAHGYPPEPGSARERRWAERFAAAFTSDDIDGVIALLTDDAWLAMPPAPHEYHGREAIADFLRTSARWRGNRRLSLVPTRANNQPAFGCYLTATGLSPGHPTGILVLTLSDRRIRAITRFLDPDLPGVFGLAGGLDPESPHGG